MRSSVAKQVPQYPIVGVKVIQGKPINSHPTFDIVLDTSTTSKLMRTYRFADFRAFYNDHIEYSDLNLQIFFPETYIKSTFGFRLSVQELEDRCHGLDKFIRELFHLREEWSSRLKKAALEFLQITEEQIALDPFSNNLEFSPIKPVTFSPPQALRFQMLIERLSKAETLMCEKHNVEIRNPPPPPGSVRNLG
mmetsp:Transcript_10225/g.12404  ORF Transcript_10225/g.12404 Transcript_10225/m.12404 type:complete len:193 (+) Transcript_10225:95-673(+)